MNAHRAVARTHCCPVCGISLQESPGLPNRSGKLLCKDCHGRFAGITHTVNPRKVSMAQSMGSAWVRQVLCVSALVLAALLTWWITRM